MSTTITAAMVNALRAKTGAGLMDCKRALVESNGNEEEAITILKKKGVASAAKRADRNAGQGTVASYIHGGGRVGVLLELNCETDFVAKNEEFQSLAKDLCMQIAAASPLYVSREDVPAEVVDKEKEIAMAQCQGKPAQAIEKIVAGKLDKFFQQVCLMEQPFVKDPNQTIKDLMTAKIAKTGENMKIRRFSRFEVGAA